jgi:hypothetical protein
MEDKALLKEVAELIHKTAEDQGWGCYHPGIGLACCEGMARVMIDFFKDKKIIPHPKVTRIQRNGVD